MSDQLTLRVDHVFATLTPAQVARLSAHGSARQLRLGEVLYEPGLKSTISGPFLYWDLGWRWLLNGGRRTAFWHTFGRTVRPLTPTLPPRADDS